MQKENNTGIIKILIGIIVFLIIIIILLATGKLRFEFTGSGTNQSNTGDVGEAAASTTSDTVNDSQTDTSWINYLHSLHILDAKVERTRSKDLGDAEDYHKTVTLTMADVKEVLSNLGNTKLSKVWSEGRGGPDKDHLTITYEKDEEKYVFELFYGSIAVDKLDEEFKNILDKNKYEEKDTEYKDSEGAFYYYNIDGYTETIFDKYFK